MATTFNLAANPIWNFLDTEGKQLADGSLFTFRDVNRSEKKATFRDPGGVIAYENPIVLNGNGQIDTLIYWADDENYFLQLRAAPPVGSPREEGQLIRSIPNFNATTGGGAPPITTTLDIDNHIINGQFRFFVEDLPTPLPSTVLKVAAPKWFFTKNNTNATDSITFIPFNLGQTDVEATPIFALQYECTAIGAGGETFKDIYFEFPDVNSFELQEISISFDAKSITNSTIELRLEQFFGTGGAPSATVDTLVDSFVLNPSFQKVSSQPVVLTTGGSTKGTDGNDAFRMKIRMPLNAISNVNMVNLQLERGNIISPFEYRSKTEVLISNEASRLPVPTEDDVSKSLTLQKNAGGELLYSLVGAPPTGSIVMWAAPPSVTEPEGFLFCNGQDTTPTDHPGLFSVIDRIYGTGYQNFIVLAVNQLPAQLPGEMLIPNNTGGVVSDAVDVSTGFIVERTIRGSVNEARPDGVQNGIYGVFFGGFAGSLINFHNLDFGGATAPSNGTMPAPFNISLARSGQAGLTQIVTIQFTDGLAPIAGKFFTIFTPVRGYYVWYTVDGVGVDPNPGGLTGIQVDVGSIDDGPSLARKTGLAIGGRQSTRVVCNAASTLSGGEYWKFTTTGFFYYVWYTVDGVGVDPNPGGGLTGVQVDLLGADTNIDVANKTRTALHKTRFQVPDYRGILLRGRNAGRSNQGFELFDPDVLARPPGPNEDLLTGDFPGTWQLSTNKEHDHEYTRRPAAGSADGPNIRYSQGDDILTNTSFSGGFESRPPNIYVDFIIKT